MTSKEILRQKLWREFLDKHFCKAGPFTGNRPCDNGAWCDRCSSEWAKKEFDKMLEKHELK